MRILCCRSSSGKMRYRLIFQNGDKPIKIFMRENYGRVVNVRGPVQEIPHPDGRVTVNSVVTD